jgi:hypothetical protein
MTDPKTPETPKTPENSPEFKRRSLAAEFFDYLMENKKWWMIPIILVVLALTVLLVFANSAAAPFLYAMF